jgi:hypothetical protein
MSAELEKLLRAEKRWEKKQSSALERKAGTKWKFATQELNCIRSMILQEKKKIAAKP